MSGSVITQSLAQTWPPFVLVSGLVLVGAVAADDGLFEALGTRLARSRANELTVLTMVLALVALVTVVLNLDTAVVFVTPVALHVARRRGADLTTYLYGAIFMSNAASLLLPGSNLTNLLVLSADHGRGVDFAQRMIGPWLAAVVVTWAVLVIWRSRRWPAARPSNESATPLHLGVGAGGVVLSVLLTLTLTDPAPYVFAVGAVVAGTRLVARRVSRAQLIGALNPIALLTLFLVTLGLGALARVWSGPARLVATTGTWASAGLAALMANVLNNLPAAVLVSARAPAHPLALLIGLNVGPNLVVTGALSVVLWRRVARQEGVATSAATYTRVGLVLVPLSLIASLAALSLIGPVAL